MNASSPRARRQTASGAREVLGAIGDDVDSWITERVLDPTRVLFHEDDLVFAADPSLPDANVYRSILAAVVAGERTPTGVARVTGPLGLPRRQV